MTTKVNNVLPLNSLGVSKEKKSVYHTNSTLPGFHHVQHIQGNQIWFVFDNQAPKDIFIEL